MPDYALIRREIDSLEEVFRVIEAFVAREGLDEKVGFSLNVVAEELFTNMVKYNSGNGDRIALNIRRENDRILLELVDFDVDPFDPSSVEELDVHRPIQERQPGGLGLHIVKSLVDDISYEYENRQMRVQVIKRVGR